MRQEILDADMLWLLDMNHTNLGLQVPAKLYEYVRVGRPIVALTPRGSATARVVALAAAPHCCIDPGAADAQFDLMLAEFLATPHPVRVPSDMFLSAFDARAQADQLGVIRYATAASRLAQAPAFRQNIDDWRHQCAD